VLRERIDKEPSVEVRNAAPVQKVQKPIMTWNNIRLELARTRDFPEGSASRCYLLRLPLTDDGLIDETARKAEPGRATVRRFWPNEPDLSGYVIRTPRGWAFSYRPGEDDDETVFHLETHPMRLGEYVTLTEPDGERLPFRVASLKSLSLKPATG
jgi:hypothetical protein